MSEWDEKNSRDESQIYAFVLCQINWQRELVSTTYCLKILRLSVTLIEL